MICEKEQNVKSGKGIRTEYLKMLEKHVESQIEKEMFKGSRRASLKRGGESHFERTPNKKREKENHNI